VIGAFDIFRGENYWRVRGPRIHGLYVLEGKAVYRLNEDWVEVQEGTSHGSARSAPQACYAGGTGRFRYLLYKDVNRHRSFHRHS
jgi:(S)-ureidoglycine aminohydrolase